MSAFTIDLPEYRVRQAHSARRKELAGRNSAILRNDLHDSGRNHGGRFVSGPGFDPDRGSCMFMSTNLRQNMVVQVPGKLSFDPEARSHLLYPTALLYSLLCIF